MSVGYTWARTAVCAVLVVVSQLLDNSCLAALCCACAVHPVQGDKCQFTFCALRVLLLSRMMSASHEVKHYAWHSAEQRPAFLQSEQRFGNAPAARPRQHCAVHRTYTNRDPANSATPVAIMPHAHRADFLLAHLLNQNLYRNELHSAT